MKPVLIVMLWLFSSSAFALELRKLKEWQLVGGREVKQRFSLTVYQDEQRERHHFVSFAYGDKTLREEPVTAVRWKAWQARGQALFQGAPLAQHCSRPIAWGESSSVFRPVGYCLSDEKKLQLMGKDGLFEQITAHLYPQEKNP